MAKKIEEILSESAGMSDELKAQISEAWSSKITEAREEVATTLREEFARKFEHDKGVLVESMDRFLTDRVRVELEEFVIDKKELVEQRVAYKQNMKKHTELLNRFVLESIAKEVREFHSDSKLMKENFNKLENFLLKQLAEEIREFRTDKKSLVEQKVRMVSEGQQKLKETKQQFIKRASTIIDKNIEKALVAEMSQFKEDIRIARENEFGRRIFESVAVEFMNSYLNEGTELYKIQQVLESKNVEMKTLKESVQKNSKIVEGLDSKLKATQDLVERQKTMTELLAPLSKEKKGVMKELLESVQTKNLGNAFNKYLPSVLNETQSQRPARPQLRESVMSERTGNRTSSVLRESADGEDQSELRKLISLAGITK